jgi:hypothetical protein
MRFLDKNQTLEPPEGYKFRSTDVDGAYLRLTYYQSVYQTGTLLVIGENVIVVYLNDMGREVGRSTASYRWPQPDPLPVEAAFSRQWQFRLLRFKNGFLIVLQGLQEMIKCLKS